MIHLKFYYNINTKKYEYYIFFVPEVNTEYDGILLYETEYTDLEDNEDISPDVFRIYVTYDEFVYLLMIILYDNNFNDITDVNGVSFLPSKLDETEIADVRRLGQWDVVNAADRTKPF